MKLPRWLVVVMLSSSVLAPLGAAAWWWVTWPDRTAREFVELLVAGTTTSVGRAAPGSIALFKVYVVLTTGNEKRSSTVKITRPA